MFKTFFQISNLFSTLAYTNIRYKSIAFPCTVILLLSSTHRHVPLTATIFWSYLEWATGIVAVRISWVVFALKRKAVKEILVLNDCFRIDWWAKGSLEDEFQ